MGGMSAPSTSKEALQRAISQAGGKTALMRKLNERGHDIKSHNVISQWEDNGVPAKYCPDIEAVSDGVRCEELNPDVNWSVLRKAA
jgi:DNA-binding transcriptional regulator YdaS (Cro superfamily)